MNPRLLEILQHTLGVDQYGRGKQYRNYFCAGVVDEPLCRELVSLGFMEQYQPCTPEPYPYFRVTESGMKAVRSESPAPPKLSAGRKRYMEFLNYAEAYDCTFREWLGIRKTEWYQNMKAGRTV